MTFATLNGRRVIRARANLPEWGACFADATVDGDVTLAGACELKIADLTMKGTILSGGAEKGRSTFRLVTGAACWGKSIGPKSYSAEPGVRLATVLGDAAKAAGENLDVATIDRNARVGNHFARKEGTAARLLERYASRGWYIGEDGITRIGRRPRKDLETTAPRVVPVDRARATLVLASESIAQFVPGVVVDGLEAVDVQHELSAEGGLRTSLWGRRGAGSSRELEAFMRLMDLADPDREFRAIWEYKVDKQSGNRLDLKPVLASSGMPDLRRVSMRPGVPGAKADVMLGTRVLVAFINHDPGRPVVVQFEEADGTGFKPLLLSLDAQTFVELADGLRLMAATGDLAGGILPIVGTTRVKG